MRNELKPVGPVPSELQLDWETHPFYLFVHFGMNTFTGREWGHGGEDPKNFLPTELDCRQWARFAKEIGAYGIILTAKHHDGFCLWQSKYTKHSVASSNWKDGKGDVVRELADACKEFGLKLGLYLSPWDRTEATYGSGKEYNDFYCNQLEELLTNYGDADIFEVWFDGACGEGANGKKQVYDWPRIHEIVYRLAPKALMFSDVGPGVRWVGNEKGFAADPNWAMFPAGTEYKLGDRFECQTSGVRDGGRWLPTEADVSTRPGWFYHSYQDNQVHSLPHLMDMYTCSVGRNGSLLLNLPVDKRGLVHEAEQKRLKEMREVIDLTFAKDLTTGGTANASSKHEEASDASVLLDGSRDTYWAADENDSKPQVTVEFPEAEVNLLHLEEYTPLSQRIEEFTVECRVSGAWTKVSKSFTVGLRRFVKFETVKADAIRLTILKSKATPVLRKLAMFLMPELVAAPAITRDSKGMVTLSAPTGHNLYYTLDDSVPTCSSIKYTEPFRMDTAGVVRAITEPKPRQKLYGDENVSREEFEILRDGWKIHRVSSEDGNRLAKWVLVNADEKELWDRWESKSEGHPQFVEIDMGKDLIIKGFTYTPTQSAVYPGIIYEYAFYTSTDGENWGQPVAEGAFENIENNPIRQFVNFKSPVTARFLRLESRSAILNAQSAGCDSIGVLT